MTLADKSFKAVNILKNLKENINIMREMERNERMKLIV